MPYGWTDGTWEPHGLYGYPNYPDGGLRTSAPQLDRILAASWPLMPRDAVYDGERILAESTVGEMLTPAVPDLDETQGLIW